MLNYSKRTVLEHYSQLFSENYSKSNMFELVTLWNKFGLYTFLAYIVVTDEIESGYELAGQELAKLNTK